jgi:hypothetical protein
MNIMRCWKGKAGVRIGKLWVHWANASFLPNNYVEISEHRLECETLLIPVSLHAEASPQHTYPKTSTEFLAIAKDSDLILGMYRRGRRIPTPGQLL